MITARTIRCKVITVEADPRCDAINSPKNERADATPRYRPSDMLPWADPYIAGLVKKLQADVRQEVAQTNRKASTRFGAPVADLEWPWEDTGADFEPVTVDAPTTDDGLNWDHRYGR